MATAEIKINLLELDRVKQLMGDYEELRTLIDGGNEFMTHDDAMCQLISLNELMAEYQETMRSATAVAADQIWFSMQSLNGVPTKILVESDLCWVWRKS